MLILFHPYTILIWLQRASVLIFPCEPLQSTLAPSEISLCLRLLAVESSVREDVVLISLESDGRESNDSTELVSVPAASSASLHHHDGLSLCSEGGVGLLICVVAASPWRRFVCGQSPSTLTGRDRSFDFAACDRRRLPPSFALGLVTRSVIFSLGGPTRRRRRGPTWLRGTSFRMFWGASGEDESGLVDSYAVGPVRLSPWSAPAEGGQLGDGERMNCENISSSPGALSAEKFS